MYQAFHPKSDIDRLYLAHKIRGHGLLQIQQTVQEKKWGLHDYVCDSTERLLKAFKNENIISESETKLDYKQRDVYPPASTLDWQTFTWTIL